MEISSQIRTYRQAAGLSQEQLAERVFVTRQTVSNWENNRSYPDIHSLVLLSTLFGVSLDILVKGDLQKMKEQIRQEDIRKLERDGAIYTVLLLATVFSAVPLARFLGWAFLAVWLPLAAFTVFWAFRVEKQKTAHDVKTYREIVAFSEGRRLDELEKAREEGKRPYQAALAFVLSGAIAAAISAVLLYLLR